MENIPRFKARDFEDGRHSVVGDCNGIKMEDRWRVETPLFAEAILEESKKINRPRDGFTILDYGCGVGRLAKEVLKQDPDVTVIGIDASEDELRLAVDYINDSRFIPMRPHELRQKVDFVYCVYVLQHIPAIELREAIYRMHTYLKDDGLLFYCSSDYRMAINSEGGFTDDRHLGVDIRQEIGRVFLDVHPANFNGETGEATHVIDSLIHNYKDVPGGIPHPAIIYRKKDVEDYLAIIPGCETPAVSTVSKVSRKSHNVSKLGDGKRKLIIRNRQSPGDTLVMTATIRSLHKAFPGKFETDVDSPTPAIFENSPFITKLNGEGQVIDMHYPEIHKSGASGRHFSDGHRKFLEDVLGLVIPRTGLVPDIFLSQDEKLWPSDVLATHGWDKPFWVINAGSKSDYPLKQYHRYQEVVDMLQNRVQFVQIGVLEHTHPPLKGVLDMRGKTNDRQLYRLIYHSEGVLTCVSYPMHIAAAFQKPCVVVAGGREGTRWELYPNHRFLHTNGTMDCCSYDGCWKSKLEECAHPMQWRPAEIGQALSEVQVPKCMEMIKPQAIVDAIEMYYEGGILKREEELTHA